jgi:hypothetical protein
MQSGRADGAGAASCQHDGAFTALALAPKSLLSVYCVNYIFASIDANQMQVCQKFVFL